MQHRDVGGFGRNRYVGWAVAVALGTGLAPGVLFAKPVEDSPVECADDPQSATIYGLVRSADSVGVLAHAFVRIESEDGEVQALVLSDHRGVYLHCGIPAQRTRLSGHLGGYSSAVVEIDLQGGETQRIDLPIDFEGVPAAWDRPDRAIPPGTVHGSLVDPGSGPIVGATLSRVATDWQALSDGDGQFAFGRVLPGPHVLQIDHVAFGTVYWPVNVPSGETVFVRAELSPVALAVRPIIVTARRDSHLDRNGFYDRQRWGEQLGLGHFITREDIEAWRPSRTSAALSHVPGIHVTCGGGFRGCLPTVAGSSCNQLVLFLDGVKFTLLDDSIDDFVTPNDIAAIEVYRGLGDLASEFADPDAQRCGAVAIWTRRGGRGQF